MTPIAPQVFTLADLAGPDMPGYWRDFLARWRTGQDEAAAGQGSVMLGSTPAVETPVQAPAYTREASTFSAGRDRGAMVGGLLGSAAGMFAPGPLGMVGTALGTLYDVNRTQRELDDLAKTGYPQRSIDYGDAFAANTSLGMLGRSVGDQRTNLLDQSFWEAPAYGAGFGDWSPQQQDFGAPASEMAFGASGGFDDYYGSQYG